MAERPRTGAPTTRPASALPGSRRPPAPEGGSGYEHRADRRGADAAARGGPQDASAAFEVLRGVDLDLSRGEVVCVLGPSGSGKSTLLRCINLLEPPEEGRIYLEGKEITAGAAKGDGGLDFVRRRVGIVFQQFNLFPHKTALENVTLGPTDRARSRIPAKQGSGPRSCSSVSGSATSSTSTPTASPAASSSGSRSRGHWRWTHT